MRTCLALAAGLVCGSVVVAADLPTAAHVRKTIETPPVAQKSEEPTAGLTKQIDELAGKVGTMPAAEAADAWLGLFDAYAKRDRNEGVAFTQLLKALPPPSGWAELKKAIAARGNSHDARELALKVIADLLAGDAEARRASVEALTKRLKDQGRDDESRQLIETMTEKIPADVLKNFEAQIEGWSVLGGRATLDIPDLVTLVGKEKAEPLIRKAIVLPGVNVTATMGAETVRLVQKLMITEIDKITVPQWGMCCNVHPDSVALFEAIEKKFIKGNAKTPEFISGEARMRNADEEAYRQAQAYYVIGLIIAGRTDDALGVVKKMPPQQAYLSYASLDELEKAGYVEKVQAFLHKSLSDDPDLPLWDSYVTMSAKVGKNAEMLELARKSASRENVDPSRKLQIRNTLGRALLAADEVEEALKVLRERMSSPADKTHDDGVPAAIAMARVGRLLDRGPLVDEGLAAAKKMLAERGQPLYGDWSAQQFYKQLAGIMDEAGHDAEAVELLADAVARMKKPAEQGEPDDSTARELAFEILGLYHRAGRHADVIELLTTLPVWAADDLAGIYTEDNDHETPIGFMAAAALADAGRKDEARKVLNAVLDAKSGFDPAYELLIKLDGDEAVARLDELFARDQFEERPLIWKGTILLKQGKFDEAEKIIRQAIAIDPSDGEQGKGTRMRVYSVLADILEKKGDAEQVKVFRGAVTAIRTAEDADNWWEAGLLSAAIKRYEQALTYFQDAYCIQSRLALRMAEMGFTEEAEKHYRKAYELMPESFGRVESHCFGCEGAFKGSSARKIAEEVFTKLLKKTPDKPQLHYLLGYLREQQGMSKEALDAMQAAVKLDPDYLNAWEHISELSKRVYTPPDVRDAAAINLLRLDPLGRHASPQVEGVRNLKGLWEAAAKAASVRIAGPKELMKLPASKSPPEAQVSGCQPYDATPGAVISQTSVVQALGAVMDMH